MLRAWRQRATCRMPEAPLPWLVQITRNEALRLRGRSPQHYHQELIGEPSGEDPGFAQVNERIDLSRLLGDLSAEDRRLLELRYSDDLTQPGVAAQLGIPEGTVKVRLHRLRNRLRVALEA